MFLGAMLGFAVSSSTGPSATTAIEFYHDNQADVDAYVRDVEAEIAHLEATTPRVDIAALRERLARRQAQAMSQGPAAE